MRIPSMGKEWFKTRSLDYGSYKEACFPVGKHAVVCVAKWRKSRINVGLSILLK